jgi:hypothetical protein
MDHYSCSIRDSLRQAHTLLSHPSVVAKLLEAQCARAWRGAGTGSELLEREARVQPREKMRGWHLPPSFFSVALRRQGARER